MPVFSGEVKIKVFTDKITDSDGNTGIWKKPKKYDRIERNLKRVNGVRGHVFNPIDGTVDVTYSGFYDKIAEIEKAVQRGGTKAALLNPAMVKFHTRSITDPDGLMKAFKALPGVIESAWNGPTFFIFMPAEKIDLDAILDAAKATKQPGSITSHDAFEMNVELEEDADTDKLIGRLLSTNYVLYAELEGLVLNVIVVRGRCSKNTVKNIARKCGVVITRR
jgi:hypothetical protein